MRKVIVIGANGFLGSHLAFRLADSGINVLGLCLKGTEYGFLKDKNDITCKEFTFDNILEIKTDDIDTIYHMAWAGVSSSFKNEPNIQSQNILFGLKVMEFANLNGIRRVVIPGSAAEVSCGQNVITGYEAPAPSDLYSAFKVATRYVCQTYAKQHNIELIWTLITSIYGPGRNDDNLITYAIKTLLRGEKPSFTGLKQQWDYLYIDDLIEALIAIGEKGKGGKVYPVGSGERHRMSEYVNILRDKIDSSLPLGIGDYPYKNKDKIDNQVLDISALREDTGFEAKYSFEEGIEKTINYFKRHKYGL